MMRDMGTGANDFFETDEPVEKIRAEFDRGEKRLTERPQSSGQIMTTGLYQHLRAGHYGRTANKTSRVASSSNT